MITVGMHSLAKIVSLNPSLAALDPSLVRLVHVSLELTLAGLDIALTASFVVREAALASFSVN